MGLPTKPSRRRLKSECSSAPDVRDLVGTNIRKWPKIHGAWIYLPRDLTPADLERLDLCWATVLQDYKKGETLGGTWYQLVPPEHAE